MLPVELKLSTEKETYHLKGIDCQISIIRKIDGKPGEVSITVHSLSPEYLDIHLDPYEVVEVIVNGESLTRFDVIRQSSNINTGDVTLSGAETGNQWNDAKCSLSFPSGTSNIQRATAVAKTIGLPVFIKESSVLPTVPFTFTGKWSTAMNRCFGTQWTVAPSGVICGGNELQATIQDVLEWGSMEVEVIKDGSRKISASLTIPLTPLDVGTTVNGLKEVEGFIIQSLKHTLTPDSQTTTLELKK